MNIYELFPSKWVRAADLNGHNVKVTIRALVVENIGQPPKNENKPILYFEKTEKGLVMNKTNAMIITSIYGPETDNWMGKPITLYATKVKAFGAVHDVIRIRDQVQTISAAPDPIVEADDDVLFDDEDPDPVAAPPASAQPQPSQPVVSLIDGPTPAPVQAAYNAYDVDFPTDNDDLSPDELDLIGSWDDTTQAKEWAVVVGACANKFEASASLRKIVESQFNGKLTANDKPAVLRAFYRRQREKLEGAKQVPA